MSELYTHSVELLHKIVQSNSTQSRGANADLLRSNLRYLESELSATKEKLEAASRQINNEQDIAVKMQRRAEEAEKCISKSMNQRPYKWMLENRLYNVRQRDDAGFGEFYPDQVPLYTMPPIPPELAELQSKLSSAESLINKFEYCIQQVAAELGNPACGGVDADDEDSTTSVLVREIRKKLEAREGWQLVPIEPTDEILILLGWGTLDEINDGFKLNRGQAIDIYSAMLKAAPKP